MKTQILDDPIEAARILRAGGLVAFPTETVYGLGGDATRGEVVEAIFTAKGRPSDNPLIVHLGSVDDWSLAAATFPAIAKQLMLAFSPGPLTVVIPKGRTISPLATANLDSVGIRVPDSDIAKAMLTACRLPIAAPSANLSGKPSPTTWEAVVEDLDGRIDAILRGPRTAIGLESTVVDCCQKPPKLLRPGGITLEMLRSVEPEIIVPDGIDATANSPGLRHRHYQPKARVRLVESMEQASQSLQNLDSRVAFIGLRSDPDSLATFTDVRICGSLDEYGQALFGYFRHCDHLQVETIFCQVVDESELGRALLDRLRRAAGVA